MGMHASLEKQQEQELGPQNAFSSVSDPFPSQQHWQQDPSRSSAFYVQKSSNQHHNPKPSNDMQTDQYSRQETPHRPHLHVQQEQTQPERTYRYKNHQGWQNQDQHQFHARNGYHLYNHQQQPGHLYPHQHDHMALLTPRAERLLDEREQMAMESRIGTDVVPCRTDIRHDQISHHVRGIDLVLYCVLIFFKVWPLFFPMGKKDVHLSLLLFPAGNSFDFHASLFSSFA
jgi:hypothetical protein